MPKPKVSAPGIRANIRQGRGAPVEAAIKGSATPTANLTPPSPPSKIPPQSLAKAKAAFRNFSLSKFTNGSAPPANFVGNGQQVSAVQQQNQVNQLKSLDASGRSLRVALSDSALKQYLPSFDGKTVLLQDLMDLIQRKMSGTEFYVSGHPTLVRLFVQSQASDIIQAIKSDGNQPK
jgi:hypothetical protein